MITEKDIQTLKSYDTLLGKIANWAVVLAPVFLFVLCFFNIYLASRIGNTAGYPFSNLLKIWIKGVEVNNVYPGIAVLAMERIGTALLQVGFAVVFAILAFAYHKRRKMDQRILKTLKNKGIL